jgi:Fur family iron response transcriptional regulator
MNEELRGVRARARSAIMQAGLRATRQRLDLASVLFMGADRHVTAEALRVEAAKHGCHVSLATVYNTLRQFTNAGLLRELAVASAKTYFCTNTSNHSHFYFESENRLEDIPYQSIRVEGIPIPPPGFRVTHVDVIVVLEPRVD